MASLTIFPYNDEKVAYFSALVLGLQRLKQGGHEPRSPSVPLPQPLWRQKQEAALITFM